MHVCFRASALRFYQLLVGTGKLCCSSWKATSLLTSTYWSYKAAGKQYCGIISTSKVIVLQHKTISGGFKKKELPQEHCGLSFSGMPKYKLASLAFHVSATTLEHTLHAA